MSKLGRVPVLMYHEVARCEDIDRLAGKTQRGYILSIDAFRAQLALLRAGGFQTILPEQLLAWACDGVALPERPVLITFDDGFGGNFQQAFPALRDAGMCAAFFVVTHRIGEPSMMTWSQLREMSEAGMAIGSHTANHPLLSTLSESATHAELLDSKRMIEAALGREVRFLSLPNGDSNPYYRRLALASGYAGGFGSGFGYNDTTTDPFFWRRFAVKANLSHDDFRGVLENKAGVVWRHGAKAFAKKSLSRMLGKRAYDRLYNALYGVEEQDQSKRQ